MPWMSALLFYFELLDVTGKLVDSTDSVTFAAWRD
jgi:hypothetical protein